MMYQSKIFWARPEDYFCTEQDTFLVNIGINCEKAFPFENPCSEHLPLYLWVNLKANFTSVISHPNRLSTYPTEIYDPPKPIFTTSQKFPWATLKLFNWKPSPCVPMFDFHNVQSWFPETFIGSGLKFVENSLFFFLSFFGFRRPNIITGLSGPVYNAFHRILCCGNETIRR